MIRTTAISVFRSMEWSPGLRHGVVASGVERMAPEDAPRDQPERAEEAVSLERFLGVRRTGRGEAAASRQDGSDGEAVAPDEEGRDRAEPEAGAQRRRGAGHRRSCPTRRAISAAT